MTGDGQPASTAVPAAVRGRARVREGCRPVRRRTGRAVHTAPDFVPQRRERSGTAGTAWRRGRCRACTATRAPGRCRAGSCGSTARRHIRSASRGSGCHGRPGSSRARRTARSAAAPRARRPACRRHPCWQDVLRRCVRRRHGLRKRSCRVRRPARRSSGLARRRGSGAAGRRGPAGAASVAGWIWEPARVDRIRYSRMENMSNNP